MDKKLTSFAKNTAIGLAWLIVFLHLYRFVGLYRWRFDLLNGAHWHKISMAWSRGWIVNTLEEWAFVLFITSSVPLFLATWAVVLRKNFYGKIYSSLKKLLLGLFFPVRLVPKAFQIVKKAKTEKIVSVVQTKTPSNSPDEISLHRKKEAHSYFKIEEKVSDSSAPEPIAPRHFEATHHAHAVSETPKTDIDAILGRIEEKHKEHQNEEKKAQKQPVRATPVDSSLTQLLRDRGYYVIDRPVLGDSSLSFIALSAQQILLGEVLTQNTEWLADETSSDGIPAMWISPNGSLESPVQKLISARRLFKKEFVDFIESETVETLVCLTHGQIQNLDEVKSQWRRENVQVINASKQAKTPFLKSIQDVLSESVSAMDKDKIKKIKDLLSSTV